MRNQSSEDPNSASSSQENDDGVGDAHVVEFVGEPEIVGYCNLVTDVAAAAPQMTTAFVIGLNLTHPENANAPEFNFELRVVTPVATVVKFGQPPADTYSKFCQYRGIAVRSIEHNFRCWLTDSELLYADGLELLRIQRRLSSLFPTAPGDYHLKLRDLKHQYRH